MSKTTPEFIDSQIGPEVVDLLAPVPVSARAAKKSLSQSQTLPFSLFVATVEQAPVAISITDKKANILYINKAFTCVTGYTADEILGLNESKLSDKCTPRPVYYDLWHTISRKKIWHGQLINRRKQGERYLADLTIAPMLDEHGAISHYIGMHRDITPAHYTDQQVKNQKQMIESVINASPIAMVVLDSNRRIILDNQMYKMLISELGYKEPAFVFLDSLQEDIGDLWEPQAGTDRRRDFSNREIRMEGKGAHGVRWFSCSGNWFNVDDTEAEGFFSKQSKECLLLSINDISLLRHQQEKLQLQSLHNILAEEEHLRSIRETLLGAIHHIRQPLNQINAAIQIMSQRNESQNQALWDLLHQVQAMGEDTLNTLQRCVPEIPETAVIPVNLNQLLHEVILLNSQKLLANGVVVDWLPNPVLPGVLGAENKLRMLFKQLLDNAINAINQAGRRERLIKISTFQENGWVHVSIADSGPGIPPQQRNKVFEPFFTTRSNLGGSHGMGLVMAREIVNQHGGIIEIDPEYNQGCRFNISFPSQHNSSWVSIHE